MAPGPGRGHPRRGAGSAQVTPGNRAAALGPYRNGRPRAAIHGGLGLPFGARDGSQNTFRADGSGAARYRLAFKPCLQLSGEHLMALLAIARHSDGKTYKTDPGAFGTVSHVQLFAALPAQKGK